MLPSPTQQTVLPAMEPRRSTQVCISASSWQGWYSSVRALMTGTLDWAAKRSTMSWPNVRIITISTMEDITRALSSIGSPRPSWVSWGDRNMACPPSWAMPASNDTLVRVEDLAKIMPSTLPGKARWSLPAWRSRFNSMARCSNCCSSAGLKSSNVRKCLVADIGLNPFVCRRGGLRCRQDDLG